MSPISTTQAVLLPSISLSSSLSSFNSEDSRSNTPSSISSICTEDNKLVSPSSPFIYIPSCSPFDAHILKTIFDKHAEDGCLGLCLNSGFSVKSITEAALKKSVSEWQEEHIVIRNQLQVLYFISNSGDVQGCIDAELRKPTAFHTQEPESLATHLLTFSIASLRSIISLQISNHHTLYILERPAFTFPPISFTPSFNPSQSSSLAVTRGNIPTLEEWTNLWRAWDLVTLHMIPSAMLHKKPIDLRHKCLFYIGHIPTFLDMLLSKAIGGSPTEPQHFWNIFERGIDPHVDNPDHCHNHSEVPGADEDWPTLDSIITFRDRVRARLVQLYDDLQSGQRVLNRTIARTLVMTHEHEGFHVETLLYMLIQCAGTGTLPPPGFTAPPWALLAHQWNAIPVPPTLTVMFGPSTVTLGHDDSEAADLLEESRKDVEMHEFGWDNESPSRTINVGKFRVEWRPVSNGEFERFWKTEGKGMVCMPKSWVAEDGEIKVRTIYGPVPMEYAQYWPVLTSYDDLLVYTHWKGGRLPTEPELRLFLDTYGIGHEGGENVGFRNWHPFPATAGLGTNEGRGSNGGVWEWTSTVFGEHEGLVPTNLFTGYSVDFFDSKHQVVLGASYATIPRLASRRTVRNFYQHNYPYAWIGARVVYDA